jgi:ribosomal-protein-alanine N-acetyltransferase
LSRCPEWRRRAANGVEDVRPDTTIITRAGPDMSSPYRARRTRRPTWEACGVTGDAARSREVVLETDRLLLRPWRVAEAAVQREMWSERDPRVPPHRRLDADGHPSVAEFEEAIRVDDPSSAGLLAVERKAVGDVIGYCGLVDSGRGAHEPELAFEFLRRCWGQGYATEASWAVLACARSSGHERLWASVWDWNTASRRVLAKVGFTEVDREETIHGTNLTTTRAL